MNDFDKQAVKIFKALADPTRYKIICLLFEKGELGYADFNDVFNLSKPALSNHYRLLENADLILTRKEGLRVFVSLNEEVFKKFIPQFESCHIKIKEDKCTIV